MARWVCLNWIILILTIPTVLSWWGKKPKYGKKCPYQDDETHECCYVKELNMSIPWHFLMKCSDVPTATPAIEGHGDENGNEHSEEHSGTSGGWRKKRASNSDGQRKGELCLVELRINVTVVYGEKRCCDGWKRDKWYGECSVATGEPGEILCLNDGNATKDGKCICKQGFKGDTCEIAICEPQCKNQGECVADGYGQPVCVCSGGRFTGPQCEKPLCPMPCLNEGECQQIGFTTECVCAPGFEGPDCKHAINSGTCPVATTHDRDCHSSCVFDDYCSDTEKCCFNGCGYSCLTVVPTECSYKGRMYHVGESFKDGCKLCTCLHPGADSVNCTETFCPSLQCRNQTTAADDCCPMCKDYGAPTGSGPKFKTCPRNVTVYLQANSKKANLELAPALQLAVVDDSGKQYNHHFSVSHLSSCACNDTRRNMHHVVATSSADMYGRYSTCTFSVKIEDPFPPKFQSCPSPVDVMWDEIVMWEEPKVTDNVGVHSLNLVTAHVNNTVFGIGEFVVVYIAKDFEGNEAVCRFVVKSYHPSSKYLPPSLWHRSKKATDFTVIAIICGLVGGLIILSSMVAFMFNRCKESTDDSEADDTESDSSPPPAYEQIAKEKLPGYSATPPVYDEMDPHPSGTKTGVSNPIYTVAEVDEEVVETKIPLEDMDTK